MALHEQAVKDLLEKLVAHVHFHTFDDRAEAEELVGKLDTAHNDETEQAARDKEAQDEQDRQSAEDAAFAERYNRYEQSRQNQQKAVDTPAEPVKTPEAPAPATPAFQAPVSEPPENA